MLCKDSVDFRLLMLKLVENLLAEKRRLWRDFVLVVRWERG